MQKKDLKAEQRVPAGGEPARAQYEPPRIDWEQEFVALAQASNPCTTCSYCYSNPGTCTTGCFGCR